MVVSPFESFDQGVVGFTEILIFLRKASIHEKSCLIQKFTNCPCNILGHSGIYPGWKLSQPFSISHSLLNKLYLFALFKIMGFTMKLEYKLNFECFQKELFVMFLLSPSEPLNFQSRAKCCMYLT